MKKLLITIISSILLVTSLFGEEAEYDFVYALNYYNGVSYNSTIIPPHTKQMYLLADSMNALVFRETSLYYWSLTSEFKADWAVKNSVVSGLLAVKDSNGNIQRFAGQPYVIQYDMRDMANTISIYWGPDAFSQYDKFTKMQQAYNNAVYEYNLALQDYNTKVNELLQLSMQSSLSEEQLATFPEVPEPPANFSLVSTEINLGYPMQFSEGKYEMWFEDMNQKEIRDSRKRLVTFSATSESGGFKVFEENRWTVPVDFPDSKKTLFTHKASTLYFQPYRYKQFEKYAYESLVNPQQTNVKDQMHIWIPIAQDFGIEKLSLSNQEIAKSGYKVIQTTGSKLGYTISPLPDGDLDTSFEGIKLDFQALGDTKRFAVGRESSVVILNDYPGLGLIVSLSSLFPLLLFLIIKEKKNIFVISDKETL